MKMSNALYDVLKAFAQVWLPALTTFYGAVGSAFGLPHTQEVITIAIAFDTFLGTVLGISSQNYHKDK